MDLDWMQIWKKMLDTKLMGRHEWVQRIDTIITSYEGDILS